MVTWKHVVIIALGAGLPVLFNAVQGLPELTWATLGHAAASAALVAIAAALRSFLPPVVPS